MPHFSNQFFITSESLKDPLNLLTYHAEVESANDNVMYYRVRFHYSNGDSSEWSGILEYHVDPNYVTDKLTIRTPNITAAFSYEENPEGELIIETEPFKLFIGSGSHGSTDWDIEDVWQDDEDSREYDKNDLIVTRDMELESVDYNAKEYGTITLFGSLTINV